MAGLLRRDHIKAQAGPIREYAPGYNQVQGKFSGGDRGNHVQNASPTEAIFRQARKVW